MIFKQVPKCIECGSPVLPLALFFDELYISHSFYQYEKALEWLYSSDIIIFVGTSFSVGICNEALAM